MLAIVSFNASLGLFAGLRLPAWSLVPIAAVEALMALSSVPSVMDISVLNSIAGLVSLQFGYGLAAFAQLLTSDDRRNRGYSAAKLS